MNPDNAATPFINKPTYQPINQPQNIVYNQPPIGYPNNQIPQNYGQPYPGIPLQPYPLYPQNNPVVMSSKAPIMNQNSNNTLESIECFDDLNAASEATIIKYFQGLIFRDTKYEVSIKYRDNGDDRKVFIGKKSSSVLGGKNTFEIKVKYIPRDVDCLKLINDKKLSFDKRFFDVCSNNNALIGSPGIKILNVECGTVLGNIKQPNCCCCSDPDFQIYNNLNVVKYRVCTDGCQCAYCCCDDCCCSNSSIIYHILDSTHTHITGEIIKNEFNPDGKEMLTYKINFPIDATPEEKILLISNVLIIDCYVSATTGLRK